MSGGRTDTAPAAEPAGVPSGWRRDPALAAILLVHVTLVVAASRWMSTTIDEVAHLPAAVMYVQRGRFHLYNVNPPAMRLLQGLAAQTTDPVLPALPELAYDPGERHEWTVGLALHETNRHKYMVVLRRARLATAAVSAAAVAALYRLVLLFFTVPPARAVALLFALDPLMVGHAGLATADAGAAAAALLLANAAVEHMRRQTLPTALLLGTER